MTYAEKIKIDQGYWLRILSDYEKEMLGIAREEVKMEDNA